MGKFVEHVSCQISDTISPLVTLSSITEPFSLMRKFHPSLYIPFILISTLVTVSAGEVCGAVHFRCTTGLLINLHIGSGGCSGGLGSATGTEEHAQECSPLVYHCIISETNGLMLDKPIVAISILSTTSGLSTRTGDKNREKT